MLFERLSTIHSDQIVAGRSASLKKKNLQWPASATFEASFLLLGIQTLHGVDNVWDLDALVSSVVWSPETDARGDAWVSSVVWSPETDVRDDA